MKTMLPAARPQRRGRRGSSLAWGLLIATCLLSAATCLAEMPESIAIQGRFTESDGSLKPDGLYSPVVRLRDSSGVERFRATLVGFQTDGTFHSRLTGPFPSFDQPFCMSLQLPGEAELPCKELALVPHSMRAAQILAGGARTGSLQPGAVTREKLAAGAITSSDFAAGAVGTQDLDGSSVVRNLGCFRDPEEVWTQGTTGRASICGTTIHVTESVNALLIFDVRAEHGCESAVDDVATVWTDMRVLHRVDGSTDSTRTIEESSLVEPSDPDAPASGQWSGFQSIGGTVPLTLLPGSNSIGLSARVMGEGCSGPDEVWARWSDFRAHLVLLGEAR